MNVLDCNKWYDALCDACGQSQLSEVARGIAGPDVMGENNSWVGGYSKEKSKKWSKALSIASQQLTVRCLQIRMDCEWAFICKLCLQRWLETPDINDEVGEIS